MKKKKFMAVAAAVAMAAITAFSVGNTPSVKAADVTSKTPMDLVIDGNYEEKQLSKADSDVINKALGYDSGTNSVLVCGENSKGYIDWENSSIPHWKVYQTEVFMPDLSRDTDGNLVVKTDSNGKLTAKENGFYGRQYMLDMMIQVSLILELAGEIIILVQVRVAANMKMVNLIMLTMK